MVLNSNNNCFYNFTLFSPKICKENLNTEIVNNLSTGWIILIVLFVITIFYTIFGFLYNTYRKNKTGFEACPHKNFWCEIPSLVKDGCIYSYNKIYQLKNQEVKEKVKEESGYGSL